MKAALLALTFATLAGCDDPKPTPPEPKVSGIANAQAATEDCDEKAKAGKVGVKAETITLGSGSTGCSLDDVKP